MATDRGSPIGYTREQCLCTNLSAPCPLMSEPVENTAANALASTCVLLQADGVHVHLPSIPSQDHLRQFAQRIFDSGSYFISLNYALFMALLYGNEPLAQLGQGRDRIKLAEKIAAFPPERLDLYKGLKIDRKGDQAEYLFEPVYLEIVRSEPVYGLPEPDGTLPIVNHRQVTEQIPAKLDFDEFVAALWLKGLLFGLDEPIVREAIRTGKTGRMTIAAHRPPTASVDAEIREETDRLHQDRSLQVLPNGRIDIRKAKNRFPQVTKDTSLLRKIPRALGEPGYRVTGVEIAPRIPKDLSLDQRAGEGTRVDHTAAGDVLMANRDGFLSVDTHSGLVSVSTKIENKEGVSIKATGGDLSLDVEDFTEHGEVQEGRVVEGNNLTFHGTVYGTIVSRHGKILMRGNLSSGRATAIGGDITVRGKAINSRLEAMDGKIHMETAEECTILGKQVSVALAVNCEIIAEHLQVRTAEGCALAGMDIRVESSGPRKFNETVISIVLPDIPALDARIAETREEIDQLQHEIQTKNQRLINTQSNDGFANYLQLREKVGTGAIHFTPEQQEGWEKLVARYAPLLQTTDDLSKKLEALQADLSAQETHRSTCGTTEQCQVVSVRGDTVVQKMISGTGISTFPALSSQQIKVLLRRIKETSERIFSGNGGSVQYPAPKV